MKPTKKNNWFVFLTGFIFIIVIVWIFSQIQAQNQIKQLPNNTPSSNSSSASIQTKKINLQPETTNNQSTNSCQYFYYAKTENNYISLYRFCPISKINTLLYFDKDEQNKIASALGVTKENKIIIWEQNNDKINSQLILLTIKPKIKKEVLLDNFFSANTPSLSPNQEWLAFTSFSNAEKNFGFTLFIEKINGTNKREIIHTGGNILSPRFSWDNKKLAFIVNRGSQGTSIVIYDLNSNQQKTILDSDKIITDLAWKQDKIIFTASPSGTATANQSEIFELNPVDKKYRQLTYDTIYQGHLFSYNQGLNLTYIQKKLSSGVPSENLLGDVKCLKCQLNFQPIKANYIFGWQKIK